MRQYLHMLSNTTAISPTDTWKLTDKYISPQIGDQYAIGFYKDILNKKVETSIEVYYKEIKDLVEYKEGAELLMNEKKRGGSTGDVGLGELSELENELNDLSVDIDKKTCDQDGNALFHQDKLGAGDVNNA